MRPRFDMNCAAENGSDGVLQRSLRKATLRLDQKPISRGTPPSASAVRSGMAIIDQGRNISRLQPSGSSAVALSHGPSHSKEYSRSGAIVPSMTEPPRFTVNQ